MTNFYLEVRPSRFFSIVTAAGPTVIILIFIYHEKGNLFSWRPFNPHGIDTLIFLLFSAICLFWWAKFFDKKPQLIIDGEGIWTRKNRLPFSSLRLIGWNKISFFYYVQKNQKNAVSRQLAIGQKEEEKETKIELYGLDKPVYEILSLIRNYAGKYGFQDLGEENQG